MKVLYVGDGRTRVNWGAKATSTALYNLVAKDHDIIATIQNTDLDSNYQPASILLKVVGKNIKKFPFKQFASVLKKLGFKNDFITVDTDTSIEGFMKIKAYYPELQEMYDKIQKCDAVVLNAEGAFIFSKPARRGFLFYLLILSMAHKLGKKTFCLNGMVSDCPVSGRNQEVVDEMVKVFRKCDGLTVRDKQSYGLLKEFAPDLDCQYIPDALFTWHDIYFNKKAASKMVSTDGLSQVDFSKPYICISGGSRARLTTKEATAGFIALVNKLKETGLDLYLVPTCKYDAFLKDVADATQVPLIPVDIPILSGATLLTNAAALVSGRFHPTILASLGGTPCVIMSSNSHKTLSIQEVLEYDKIREYNAIPSEAEINEIYGDVQDILKRGEELRAKITDTVERLAAAAKKVAQKVK